MENPATAYAMGQNSPTWKSYVDDMGLHLLFSAECSATATGEFLYLSIPSLRVLSLVGPLTRRDGRTSQILFSYEAGCRASINSPRWPWPSAMLMTCLSPICGLRKT